MEQPHSDDNERIRELLEKHVPEVRSGMVVLKGIARVPGQKCLLLVSSPDPAFNVVGACTGPRGSRVKALCNELGRETVDIIRWSSSPEQLIANAVAPMHFIRLSLDETRRRATLTPAPDSRRLPSQAEALRLSLVSHLIGWELKVDSEDAG